MPTLVACMGLSPAITNAYTVAGTAPATIVSDGPTGSGGKAVDFTATAQTSQLQPGMGTVINGAVMVLGFAFKPTSSSGGQVIFFSAPGATFPSLTCNSSLALVTGGGAPVMTSTALTAGRWYWADWTLDVTTTTWSSSLKVTDLVTGNVTFSSSNTVAGTAGVVTGSLSFGMSAAQTASFRVTDVVASNTSADYPLGPHHVLALVPSAYDAADTVTAADFAWNDAVTNNQALTTGNPAAAIAELPWTTTVGTSSGYVKQITGSTTALAAFTLTWAGVTAPDVPNIVIGKAEEYLESGSTSSTPTTLVLAGGAGGTSTNITAAAVTSSAAAVYPAWVKITAPAGGWTNANLLTSIVQFGKASVVTSPPCLGNVMLEAAFPYVAGPGPELVAAPMHR